MRLVETQIVRTCNVNRAARLEHSKSFAQDRLLIAYVFQNLIENHEIESRVGER